MQWRSAIHGENEHHGNPESHAERHPLTANQAGLWHIQHLVPESRGYNSKFSARITSPLDVEALRRACARLVDRHAALRTTFEVEDGVPYQRVHATLDFVFEVRDTSTWTEEERTARATQDLRRPFDLAHGPAFRMCLYVVGPSNTVMVFSMHHLLIDLTSVAVLAEDLGALYTSEVTGAHDGLTPLRAQYPDFVRWQAAMTSGPTGEKAEAFWRAELARTTSVLDLPGDRQRPPLSTYEGSYHHFHIDARLAQGLRDLGARLGQKPFETMLTTFQLLLGRMAQEEQFFVGTLMSGRTLPRFAPMAGYFTNVVPIRADLAGHPTFGELAARTSAALRDAHEHRLYPYSMLTRCTPDGRPPQVRAVFGIQTTERLKSFGIYDLACFGDPAKSRMTIGAMTFEPWALTHQNGNFDVQLWLADVEGGYACELKYSTDLFDAGTIERMAKSYVALLEDVVARPDVPVDALELLSHEQQHEQLQSWNATRVAEDPRCFHELFEAQASKTPDATAVVIGAASLTYAELDRRANQLAHHLIDAGARPGALVGLFVERSLEMLVGLLGILKSGAAYIPMDPIYPPERLAWMIEDGKPVAVVTESRLRASLPTDARGLVRIELDSDRDVIAARPATKPAASITAEDLAYVIFTSGSTGRPKGVELKHRGLTSFLRSMAKEPGITADDRLVAVTTLSFDIAALELFLPLIVGATVIVATREAALDGRVLGALIDEARATIVQATPVTWRMLLTAGWRGSKSVKILCGGEAMPTELARELLDRSAMLWNMYGPTETTIWSLVKQVTEEDCGPDAPAVQPIGRPIDNTTVYVLGPDRRPLPIGVKGEIHIGGVGVARGYLGREALTAEKFVADPYSIVAGERMYRTGDLGRFRADGVLEFLGRGDNQIKLRGYRIELQEIEAVLTEHPAVQSGAVIVRDDARGDKRLVAYVVTASGQVPSDLAHALKQKLPEYMVPTAFHAIDQLPQTPNGKVDRRALAVRKDVDTVVDRAAFVAPKNPLETKLAHIYARVLGVERVSVDRSFFDLGGNSMIAMKLVAQVEAELGTQLPIATVFRSPAVRQLAEAIQGGGAEEKWRSLEVLQAGGARRPLFFVGSISFAKSLLPMLGEDQPVYGLNFWSLIGGQKEVGDLSVVGMAAAYLEEIRAMQPHGPYRLCAYCDDGLIAHELANQLVDAGEEVEFLGFIDTFRYIRKYRKYNLPSLVLGALEFGPHYLQVRGERRVRITRRWWETVRGKLLVKSGERSGRETSIKHYHVLVHQAYLKALAEYRARFFDGRVTLFASREMLLRFPEAVERPLASDIHVLEVPGFHDKLFESPQVDVLGTLLSGALERLDAEPRTRVALRVVRARAAA
ncbi:amino acid adenylation domain-containing protein [Myxococcota bacterium]|nr:amino acid adenylation domain-containing protein [Myxococcota bacterium]